MPSLPPSAVTVPAISCLCLPRWLVHAALCGAVALPGGAGFAADANSAAVQACAARLQAITAQDARLAQVERIYRRHLRFSGSAHRLIPHFHAEHEDIVRARQELTETDIPFVVYRILKSEKSDGTLQVAVGVLKLFGSQAVPCIDAALASGMHSGAVLLNQVKSSIQSK